MRRSLAPGLTLTHGSSVLANVVFSVKVGGLCGSEITVAMSLRRKL